MQMFGEMPFIKPQNDTWPCHPNATVTSPETDTSLRKTKTDTVFTWFMSPECHCDIPRNRHIAEKDQDRQKDQTQK